MAPGITQGVGRYFSIQVDQGTREVVIERQAEKTQSALVFVRTLSQSLYYSISSPERDVRQIAASIISGYEAKIGILLQIWNCLLRCLGFTPEIDKLQSLLTAQIQPAVINYSSYPRDFFVPFLEKTINAFDVLPGNIDLQFFPQARTNEERASRLRAFSFDRLLELGNALHQAHNSKFDLIVSQTLDKYRQDPHAYWDVPISKEVKEVSAKDAAGKQLKPIARCLNLFFFHAADRAMKEGSPSQAARCLSRLFFSPVTEYYPDFSYALVSGSRFGNLEMAIFRGCLSRGELMSTWQLAQQHRRLWGTAYSPLGELNEIKNRVKDGLLNKPVLTEEEFQLSLSMMLPYDHDSFLYRFIEARIACGAADHASRAILSTAPGILSSPKLMYLAQTLFLKGNYAHAARALAHVDVVAPEHLDQFLLRIEAYIGACLVLKESEAASKLFLSLTETVWFRNDPNISFYVKYLRFREAGLVGKAREAANRIAETLFAYFLRSSDLPEAASFFGALKVMAVSIISEDGRAAMGKLRDKMAEAAAPLFLQLIDKHHYKIALNFLFPLDQTPPELKQLLCMKSSEAAKNQELSDALRKEAAEVCGKLEGYKVDPLPVEIETGYEERKAEPDVARLVTLY
ncbi:MAG: hypothetical protein HYX48_00520 [Chlamydiales bacterium]|nr:hypothetical protein [Chlamydiales bacterium]